MQNKKYQWDLGSYGIIEYDAVVVTKYSIEKIQYYVDYLIANQNQNIKNPAGWIIKTIRAFE